MTYKHPNIRYAAMVGSWFYCSTHFWSDYTGFISGTVVDKLGASAARAPLP